MDRAKSGDLIIFNEISRMARSILEVLEIIRDCSEKGIEVHIVKSKMIVDGSIQSKAVITMHSFVAEMERDLISERTKDALARRKAEGVILGRRKGQTVGSKLDKRKEEILKLMKSEVTISNIARIMEASRSTVYKWLENNNIEFKKS